MRYRSFTEQEVKRFFDTFESKSTYYNYRFGKYNSDSERFVKKFFNNRYSNLYIVLIDRLLDGVMVKFEDSSSYIQMNNQSQYDVDYKPHHYLGDEVITYKKKYLNVVDFESINGFNNVKLIMHCKDIFDNPVHILLSRSNVLNMQFDYISRKQFEEAKSFFVDDRDVIKYEVERPTNYEEVKIGLPNMIIRDVVYARDRNEAYKKLRDAGNYSYNSMWESKDV